MSGPSYAPQPQQVRVDRRFRVFEVPSDERSKRTRCQLLVNEKTKTTSIVHEEYMPVGKQYDVIVNRSGASIRCLESEMRFFGFDKSPTLIDVDSGEMIPTDEDVVKVSLTSTDINT